MTDLSAKLDPQALLAALEANHAHKSDPGRKGCGIEKAIRAYLAQQALRTTEAGEMVAWRGEIPGGVRKFTAIKRVSEIWADQGLTVTPLYAHPATQDAVVREGCGK